MAKAKKTRSASARGFPRLPGDAVGVEVTGGGTSLVGGFEMGTFESTLACPAPGLTVNGLFGDSSALPGGGTQSSAAFVPE